MDTIKNLKSRTAALMIAILALIAAVFASNPVHTAEAASSQYTYGGIDYSLVFNPTYYAAKYPDLKAAFGSGQTSSSANNLFSHFINNGMKETRQASSNFDVNYYKASYVDLQRAFGNNMPAYYRHYITNG